MILLFHNFLHFAKLLNKKYGTHTESRILHLHKIFYSAEKWENSQWIILDKKKHTNYFAELPFLAVYYYCFSFPIEYYPITKGKYRITKSLWDKDREIKLNAMFEIN